MVNALEVTNAEQQAVCMQFAAISQALDYIAEVVYHCFVVGKKDPTKEWEGMQAAGGWCGNQ